MDSVLSGGSIARLELKMGDRIRIYSNSEVNGTKEGFVEVEGMVKRPGKYSLYKNLKVLIIPTISFLFKQL